MASTSEIKNKRTHLFMHHQVKLKLKKKKKEKRKRKTTSCMDMLFLVREYFRTQKNLFNSLWNLKYFAYRKEIPKARASRMSLT